MYKTSLFAALLLAIGVLFFIMNYVLRQHDATYFLSQNNQAKIILHKQGKSRELKLTPPEYDDLLVICEEALTSSSSMLKQIALPSMIDKFKTQEVSVEIIYPKSKQLQIGRDQSSVRDVTIDRLLIPLSGEYAETPKQKFVTVFYGVGQYDGTPYTNSEAYHQKIAKILGLSVQLNNKDSN